MYPEKRSISFPGALAHYQGNPITNNGRCDTAIYDEFNAASSPELQQVISEFAAKGVSVHVQFVRDIATEGYNLTGTDVGDAYVDAVEQACGWSTSNALTVVMIGDISNNDIPHYFAFDTQESGGQSSYQDEHPSVLANVKQTYKDGLLLDRSATTYQQDATNALEELYGHEFAVAQAPQPTQAPRVTVNNIPVNNQPPANNNLPGAETVQSSKKPDGISTATVEYIAGSGVGIAAIAAVGAQIFRTKNVKKVKAELISTTEADNSLAADVFLDNEDENRLTSKVKDALPDLRKHEADVLGGRTAFAKQIEDSKRDMDALRRIMPSSKQAKSILRTYKASVAEYMDDIRKYQEGVAELQKKFDGIDSLSIDTVTAANSAIAAVDTLKDGGGDVITPDDSDAAKFAQRVSENLQAQATEPAEPEAAAGSAEEAPKHYYDVSYLQEKINAAQALITKADKLKADEYVDEPYDLYAQAKAAMEGVEKFVADLPAFHAQIIEDTAGNNSEQVSRTKTLAQLNDIVTSIKNEYDDSCFSDIDEQLATATGSHTSLDGVLAEIGEPKDQYDIAKLVADRAALDTIGAEEATYGAADSKIRKHQDKLNDLRDNLPSNIDNLFADQQSAEAFTLKEAEDIDDPTEQAVYVLKQQIQTLQKDAKADKPHYLEIERDRTDLVTALEAAEKQARAEKQEMVSLREQVDRLQREVDDAISTIQNYEARESDVDSQSEYEISALRSPNGPTASSRIGLRQAVSEYRQALNHIAAVSQDAHADVQRAEDARRRAEEARQQALRDAERARQQAEQQRQAYHNSSMISGGGGGGHHNSGMI